MTQQITNRSHYRTLPGAVYTPEGAGRETESLVAPFTLEQLTFTIAGANPIDAGDYEFRFVGPLGAFTITVTLGAVTPTAAAVTIAAALNADPQSSYYFLWTSALGVVTGVARSGQTSFPLPTTTTNGGTTNTAAISVASAQNALRMGLWYVYGTPQVVGSFTGTPRGARLAALPSGSTTIPLLRGVIGRVVNQTTLANDFIDGVSNDSYRAGQVFFGALRAEVCTVVDPASAAMTVDGQVHVVIAAGVYSVIGAVAAVADGGNTLRIDNTSGVVRGRVTAVEETLQMANYSARIVVLEVNQTN